MKGVIKVEKISNPIKRLSASVLGVTKISVVGIPFPINVLESNDGQISVEIFGDEKIAQEIRIEQKENKIRIFGSEKLSGNGNIIISNNNISIGNNMDNLTIISGSSVSGRSGRVIIDNVDVTDFIANKKVSGSTSSIEKIDIYIPKNFQLKLSRLQESVVVNVDVSTLTLNLSGSSRFDINGLITEAEVDLSGQVTGKITKFSSGILAVTTSGQSSVDIYGNFKKVKVKTSGQSSVHTSGTVAGNYTVKTSGQSHGSHVGEVEGNFEKECSGTSCYKKSLR